jgi:hypothetical protein
MKSANGFFMMIFFTSVGTFHPLVKRTRNTNIEIFPFAALRLCDFALKPLHDV